MAYGIVNKKLQIGFRISCFVFICLCPDKGFVEEPESTRSLQRYKRVTPTGFGARLLLLMANRM